MRLITKINEKMTRNEVIFKRNVLKFLREDGFPKFADYLSEFHFNFLTSEQAGQTFIAAVDADHGVVYINPNVDSGAISLLLRHEAGHVIFKHNEHFFAKLKKLGIDTPNELASWISNKAGDYHIANTLYDSVDYLIAKGMSTAEDGKVGGLVTELDFPENPEYWTMDFDDLWDVFVKDYDPELLKQKALSGSDSDSSREYSEDFIKGWNLAIDAYNNGKLSLDEIQEIINKA